MKIANKQAHQNGLSIACEIFKQFSQLAKKHQFIPIVIGQQTDSNNPSSYNSYVQCLKNLDLNYLDLNASFEKMKIFFSKNIPKERAVYFVIN